MCSMPAVRRVRAGSETPRAGVWELERWIRSLVTQSCTGVLGVRRGRTLNGASQEGGFTLVEVLVASSVALVMFAATMTLLESSTQIQARDTEWALTLEQDRAGPSRMVREIRAATRVEEAKASSIVFVEPIAGTSWKIKYECVVVETGTAYNECVRLAAEEGKSLPTSGPRVASAILNGSEVFSYSPSSTSPTVATVKLELPAEGTLKQAGGGFKHKVALEDAAFMRNLYLGG
jgi:prepilin-type N-terminal cleavage/methylation domain-containing protein